MEKGTNIGIRIANDTLSMEELNTLIRCAKEIEQNKLGRVMDIFLGLSEITITTADTMTVEELTKLAQCIRNIEQKKPNRHIGIFMNTPDKTVKEMEQVIDSISPGFDVKKVIPLDKTVEEMKKSDGICQTGNALQNRNRVREEG